MQEVNIPSRKTIFVIIGSASSNSSNHKMAAFLQKNLETEFDVVTCGDLKNLPHFDPELSATNPPQIILEFRKQIEGAHAVLICTPEYVFSIPAGLKNALEWCVSTTVFSGKITALMTASASGQKAHEELQLIMKTLMADFKKETTLLIQGVRGKINEGGEITDLTTKNLLLQLADELRILLESQTQRS